MELMERPGIIVKLSCRSWPSNGVRLQLNRQIYGETRQAVEALPGHYR